MIDSYGRNITSIRISVTQKCNLKCPYCHKEGENTPGDEISVNKIKEIVECASGLGIKKVKLTGGEPLLRRDIVKIVETISNIDGIEEVSLTTNGTLLEQFAQPLANAGLNRVNIGCDSLSSSIAGKTMNRVMPGILAAISAGLYPIKLNMVVLKGINDHEIEDMMDFAKKYGVILQLIELVQFDKDFYRKYSFSLDEIEMKLGKRADKIITRKMNSRKQYYIGELIVEVVRPKNNRSFCENCTKIRITSDGKIKPCLMRDDNLVDISNGKNLKNLFNEALKRRAIYYGN